MYANLGPGHVATLDPPASSGVDLLYSHGAVAQRMHGRKKQLAKAEDVQRNLYSYCENNGIRYVDPSGLKVEVCQRTTNIPIARSCNKQHYWLRITGKATGRGNVRDKCCNSCIFSKTIQTDHSMEKGTCVEVGDDLDTGWHGYYPCGGATYYACDEACLNNEMEVGKPEGRFVPQLNDCYSWVVGTLEKCCKSECDVDWSAVCLPCKCFAAGTPVLCRNGWRPIEQICSDDLVWAYDLVSRRRVETRVIQHERYDGDFDLLEVGISRTESVAVTTEHAFHDGRKWVPSGSLYPKGVVLSASGDLKSVVGTLPRRRRNTSVFNLRTEHGTYLIGLSGIVVADRSVFVPREESLKDGQHVEAHGSNGLAIASVPLRAFT